MTAEIAIMNRQGIALAADSAVTINYPGGPKVYNSVNKLFTLSKYHPVGIMVFGSADLTGVPWETIIKSYRQQLGRRAFDHIEGYADNLIQFINSHRILFTPEQQSRQFLASVVLQFRAVLRDFENQVKRRIAERGPQSPAQLSRLLTATITRHRTMWVNAKRLAGSPNNFPNRLRRRWSSVIDTAMEFVFGTLPRSGIASQRLREIAGLVFSADLFPDNVSGIVIAGFGDEDYFPRLISFDVEGVLLNFMKIRHNVGKSQAIDGNSEASLIPFAQSEMVALFMEGIDPRLKATLPSSLETLVTAVLREVDGVAGVSSRARTAVQAAISNAVPAILQSFINGFDTESRSRHIDPVVDSIGHLPKEELAAMAESLVSLTSFRRRVTRDPETVGGPIDVAVISKGDGFIWIKRKHYFDPELNHQFFTNYFPTIISLPRR